MEDTLQDALKTQPSLLPRYKSTKTTLHYVIQKDGARDLVLPPPGLEHLHAQDLHDYHQNVTEHITISEHKEYTLAPIIVAIEEAGP